MNYNRARRQKTAGVIRYSCGILFALFSFVYIYFLQGDVMAVAQHVFSHGITHYSFLCGAIIVTGVLLVLQWIVAVVTKLPPRWYALSFVPSFLLLAIVTDFNRHNIHQFTFGHWLWIAPLVLILFVACVLLVKSAEKSVFSRFMRELPALLWPNYLVLFACIVLLGLTHSADDVFMYELKTERLILQHRYDEASRVGLKSLEISPRLANLRMHALSMTGQLGECLFDYPQPFGENGLINLTDTDQTYERFTTRQLCLSLGAVPAHSVSTTARYLQLLQRWQQQWADSLALIRQTDSVYLATNDSLRQRHEWKEALIRRQMRRTADYVLCAQLLRHDLQAFVATLPLHYHLSDSDETVKASLPRAYREALAQAAPLLADTATLAQRRRYVQMRDTLADPLVRHNLTRRQFGKTFWWHYDNQ